MNAWKIFQIVGYGFVFVNAVVLGIFSIIGLLNTEALTTHHAWPIFWDGIFHGTIGLGLGGGMVIISRILARDPVG